MADADCITKLIALASDDESLLEAQHAAAKKELRAVDLVYPRDACAITQSCLAQAAGINVPDTYLALAYGMLLEKRGWSRVSVGKQAPGDVGSTCKDKPDHGNDHVYLVLKCLNEDEMVVADNQSTKPHFRYASGKGGKTPTTHFLRAPQVNEAAQKMMVSGATLTGAPSKAGAGLAPSATENALRRILSVLEELVADAQNIGKGMQT